jgi:hypothetical protein
MARKQRTAPVLDVRTVDTVDRVLARLDAASAPPCWQLDDVVSDWLGESCPHCAQNQPGDRHYINTTRAGIVLVVCQLCGHADLCEHPDVEKAQAQGMIDAATPQGTPARPTAPDDATNGVDAAWDAIPALIASAAPVERHPIAVAADVADADALIGMLYPQEQAATLATVNDLAARMAAQPPVWDDADKAATAQPAIDNLAAVLEHPALALTADHLTAAGDHAALWTWADRAIVLTESIRALAASNPPGNIYQARNRWLSAWSAAHSLIGRSTAHALARKADRPYALACLACGALSGDLSAVDHPAGPVVALCRACLDEARTASATNTRTPDHVLGMIHLTAAECVTVRPCHDCGIFLPAFADGPAQCETCKAGDTAFFRTRYGRPLTANELTALETPTPAR